ncbi:MAG: hemolysin family protein [Tissierellia bacterium]|nr:hemolysin family protein [Tissierellia bacterium]
MSSDTGWRLFAVLICLFLSDLFTLIKFSYDSLNEIKLKQLEEEDIKNYQLIKRLFENLDSLNSALLIADYLANTAAAALTAHIGYMHFRLKGLIAGIFISTLLILIIGEFTPYALSLEYGKQTIIKFAKIANFIMVVFTPFDRLVSFISGILTRLFGGHKDYIEPKITEDELISAVNLSREEGLIDSDEFGIIENIFEFGDSYAKDAMTPRPEIATIDVESSMEEIIQRFDEEGFSRMPVYEDDLDNIIGILHVKDLLPFVLNDQSADIRTILRKPFFTFEYQRTQALFQEMRQKRIAMAIVIDEYGGTDGIITMEDLVEEIVGEIEDEYDQDDKDIQQINQYVYIVSGMVRLDELNEEIGCDLESEEFETIGGFVIGLFDRLPEVNEKIRYENMEFTVKKTDKNRIEKLRIQILKLEEEKSNDE